MSTSSSYGFVACIVGQKSNLQQLRTKIKVVGVSKVIVTIADTGSEVNSIPYCVGSLIFRAGEAQQEQRGFHFRWFKAPKVIGAHGHRIANYGTILGRTSLVNNQKEEI